MPVVQSYVAIQKSRAPQAHFVAEAHAAWASAMKWAILSYRNPYLGGRGSAHDSQLDNRTQRHRGSPRKRQLVFYTRTPLHTAYTRSEGGEGITIRSYFCAVFWVKDLSLFLVIVNTRSLISKSKLISESCIFPIEWNLSRSIRVSALLTRCRVNRSFLTIIPSLTLSSCSWR